MTDRIERRVTALRTDFDAHFGLPSSVVEVEPAQLLLVRAGPARLALRMGELSGLERAGPIVRVPGSSPLLVGISAVRGRLVAVYDVARVLGEGRGEGRGEGQAATAGAPAGFIAVARGDPTVALLLSTMEGQLAAPQERAHDPGELLTQLAIDGVPLQVLSVVAFIRRVSKARDEVRT